MSAQKQNGPSLLRSEELDEIIGRPPHWLIQRGMGILLIVFAMVGILSMIVKYPETIESPVLIISTANPSTCLAEMNVPGTLATRLKRGQPVLIKLSDYPWQQFGSIRGIIDSVSSKATGSPDEISSGSATGSISGSTDNKSSGSGSGVLSDSAPAVSNDQVFLVKIQLPEGLKTSNGKTLAYREGLFGTAGITIKNSRLINKLLHQ